MRLDVDDQFQPFGIGPLQHQARDVAEHVLQNELADVDWQFAGFNLGQIENVIDDCQQVPARCLNAADVVGHARCRVDMCRQMAHADDGIEWGANFVAHVGEKFGFGATGRFGQVSGSGKLKRTLGHLVFQRACQFFKLVLGANLLGDVQADRADSDDRIIGTEHRETDDTANGFAAVLGMLGVNAMERLPGTHDFLMFGFALTGFGPRVEFGIGLAEHVARGLVEGRLIDRIGHQVAASRALHVQFGGNVVAEGGQLLFAACQGKTRAQVEPGERGDEQNAQRNQRNQGIAGEAIGAKRLIHIHFDDDAHARIRQPAPCPDHLTAAIIGVVFDQTRM